MGRLAQRNRNRENRQRKSVVVIGCEGKNKTEKIYFSNFTSRECNIRFSTGNSTDPVGMARDLINFMKEEDINVIYGDKIYLILDTDVNQNKQEQINEAKRICEGAGIIIITSTPTFEFWYILHFEYTTKVYQNSKEVKEHIKRKINDYTEKKNVFPIIKDKLNNAISNSKKIEQYQLINRKELISEECNPYTRVYSIVEELIERNK